MHFFDVPHAFSVTPSNSYTERIIIPNKPPRQFKSKPDFDSASLYIMLNDDSLQLKIAKLGMKKINRETDLITFTSPLECMDYISNKFIFNESKDKCFLFINYSMPIINGFDVLDKLSEIDLLDKDYFKAYLTSGGLSEWMFNELKHYNAGFLPEPLFAKQIIELK